MSVSTQQDDCSASLGVAFQDAHTASNKSRFSGRGMRTATFQFSESGGSLNGPDLFTEFGVAQTVFLVGESLRGDRNRGNRPERF